MLEKIKYINHLGEELDFGKTGMFINYNDLHDFSWCYNTDSDKILSFYKGIVKKTVPVIILCESIEEGLDKRNQLFEICEKDILARQYGKICINDYYMSCYVTKSEKNNYLVNKTYMEVKLEISTDLPNWIKERKIKVEKITHAENEGHNFDFNYDFNFDYKCEYQLDAFYNNTFTDSNFILTFYGECLNPSINIAGHNYKVNVYVPADCSLTIDSVKKKIYLTDPEGKNINCFHNRNRMSYIFQKIPAGECIIAHDETVHFDIVIIEERSEPKWI